MKGKLSVQKIRSLLSQWLIFHRAKPLLSWGLLLGSLAGVAAAGGLVALVVGLFAVDYIQNEPAFCTTCHSVMIDSYEKWETSEHAGINCHVCHELSPEEGINYGIHVLKGLPNEVPPRHADKIIVPSALCMECHWEKEEQEHEYTLDEQLELTHLVNVAGKYVREFLVNPERKGPNVAPSRYHAIHYFNGQTDCLVCHGRPDLHVFTAAPDSCLNCHESQQEQIHTAKGIELECLNCHTDRTDDLMPDREKCLSCHAEDDTIRQELAAAATMDVKKAPLHDDIVAKAVKIAVPEHAPMEDLACATCHSAHQEQQSKPTSESCLSCHPSIENVGQHALHLQFVQSDCTKCHTPHSWKVTEEQAKKDCAKCHQYYEPVKFIQAKKD